MRTYFLCAAVSVILLGCNANKSSETNNEEGKPKTTQGGDFSTPQAAVESLISAAVARDAELLSKCFADNAPGEFAKLRDKTASQKDLDELAEFLQDGKITESVIADQGDAAQVQVKLKSRDESIKMTKVGDQWKIVDF